MKKQKALNTMAAMCSKKEYCEFDIREKLKKYLLSEAEVTDIIIFLKENKFLDENRFANAYVRDKCKFNNWGKIKIAAMLNSKHIAYPIINKALQSISDKEYKAICLKVLRTKSKSLNEEDKVVKKNKLIKFAMGRGFSYELIKNQLFALEEE